MINDTVEVVVTPKVLAERAREYGIDEVIPAAVLRLQVAFIKLPDKYRRIFLESLRAHVCHECGAASCLCGYPC